MTDAIEARAERGHDLYDRVDRVVRSHGMKVSYKDTSKLMYFLGALAFFNPKFADYITTWFGTVYFPSEGWVVVNRERAAGVLAHEFVHHWDQENSSGFALGYAFPQVLAVGPILGILALLAVRAPWSLLVVVPFVACALAGYFARSRWAARVGVYGGLLALGVAAFAAHALAAAILVVLLAAALAPWPAPFRAAAERRGYLMTLAFDAWTVADPPAEIPDWLLQQFVGWGYYRMSWSPDAVRAWYADAHRVVRDPAALAHLPDSIPYSLVWGALKGSPHVRPLVGSAA